MDFNDVFGGQPRRFSMQEVKVRYSFGETREPDEEKTHSKWSEKPVFGEESGLRRRRQGDDFFDDIFMGSKETDRDNGFGPCPGSRIMSPATRTSSPKAEPFGTSSPTQCSLPAKLIKAVEIPPFGSNNQYMTPGPTNAFKSPLSSSPSSRFSSQSSKGQDHKTRRQGVDHRQSPLSRQGSFSSHNSPPAEDNAESFHFSIYKWAGWGVSMLMPGLVAGNSLKSKKGNGNYDDTMALAATEDEPSCMELETEESRSKKSLIQESSYEVSQTKAGVHVKDNVVGGDDRGDVKKKIEKQVLLEKAKSLEKEAKPLPEFLLNDEVEQKPGNIKETNARTSHDEKKAKKHGKKTGPNKATVVDKSGSVKEFVQIFNQNENRVTFSSGKSKENDDKKSDVSLKVDENLNDKDQLCNRVSSNLEKNISSESIHKESKIAPENLDDPLDDDFLVQELSDDNEKVTKDDKDSEDTKAIDARIHRWSLGKKGNIRSLLSTLQYVLWSESGWKAVPLVELIEVNAVKRAYQKALLRLHPDKLQQKGAAFHQKYIAEKVFDILQEAWDHFDACSSLNL